MRQTTAAAGERSVIPVEMFAKSQLEQQLDKQLTAVTPTSCKRSCHEPTHSDEF